MLNPVTTKVVKPELKKRQEAVLKVMEENGIEALILHNSGDMFGGQYRWLTDMTRYYPPTAIFCKEGIAFFQHGDVMPIDEDLEFVDKGGACKIRNWTTPHIPSITYLQDETAKAMQFFITKQGFKKIGYCGMSFIPTSISRYLEKTLPEVQFVDFTDEVDKLMIVKSEYDIDRMMKCVDIHDKLVDSVKNFMRPNRYTCLTLNLEIMKQAMDLGAIEFNTHRICAWRNGRVLDYNNEYFQKGDYFYILVEVAAVDGEWGECGRLYRLGEEPEQKYVDAARKLLEIRKACQKAMVPGAIPEDIWHMANQMRKDLGWREEKRLFAHGQGYNIVERPMFTDKDTEPLVENTFLAIHPVFYDENGIFFDFTDNYLVTPEGALRLSKTPEEIITVTVDD